MKKKITLIICSLLFAMMGAKADGRVACTSPQDLVDNYFVMSVGCMTPYWDNDGNQPDGRMLTEKLAGTANFYRMRAQAITDYGDGQTHYRIIVVDESGNPQTENNTYFNSATWCYFVGVSQVDGEYRYGQDFNGGGLWDIKYDAAKGFSFRNVGTGKYIGTPDFTLSENANPDYWQCFMASSITAADTDDKIYDSVDDLTSNQFMLVNGKNRAAKFMEDNNITFDTPESVAASPFLFQLERVGVDNDVTYYRICVFDANGSPVTRVCGGWCLNVSRTTTDDGVVFAGEAWTNAQASYGTDHANGALWSVERIDENLFTFRNKASGGYLGLTDWGYHINSSAKHVFYCITPKVITEANTARTCTKAGDLFFNLFSLENSGTKLFWEGSHNWEDSHNVQYKSVSDAEYAWGAYYFKAEPILIDNMVYYALHIYGPEGTDVDGYYWTYLGRYLNHSGDDNGGIIFSGSCASPQYGQDKSGGALWKLSFSERRVALANKYAADQTRDKRYLNCNSWTLSDAEVYFTAHNNYTQTNFVRSNSTADKFLSFSFPYDATITGATVYTLSNVDNISAPTTAYLEEVSTGTVSAGKGYILKTTTADNVTIDADLATYSKTTSDNGALVAVLKPAKATADTYVLSSNEWLKVIADDEPNIASTRAYLDLSKAVEGEPVLGARYVLLNFEGGDETGITLQEISEENENAGMNDGKYFENGKIVIVRNGVKYSTNGQIMK